MAWEIEFGGSTEQWYAGLRSKERIEIGKALTAIRQQGPGLRRPLVGTISHSRHRNMREARSAGGNLRILFAFDPNRRAVLLVGGDKTHKWDKWYRENVPQADRIYDRHLHDIGKAVRWDATRHGTRSRANTR